MSTPTFETISLEVEDGIATLTLNRPDKLNAFNTTMMKELIAAFDATDADDSVRVVIVTGAGRGFCAGADLSAGAQTFDYDARGGEDKAARTREGVQRDGGGLVTLRIFESLKPVIAAVIKEVITAHGIKMPQLAHAVRVLVCGRAQTPSIDAVLELFSREVVIGRLSAG